MSIVFGGMRQLAFVVRDLRATLDYWTTTVGVGPFHVLSGVTMTDYTYRGKVVPSPTLNIGLSWSGAFQIEIIEQTNDTPSAYQDFLNSGREGMHHVCAWYDSAASYDAARLKGVASGASIVHEGALGSASLGTTARFAYFDTNSVSSGFYFEIAEGLVPHLQPFMTMIEETARGWDGSDPIRNLELGRLLRMIASSQTISADLTGKTVFVTGASGGLGAHFAKLLARSGCTVAVGARRLEAREEVVQSIKAQGGKACHVELDVTLLGSVRDAVEAVRRMIGPIDVLINNSGLSRIGPSLEHSEDEWDVVLDTNLKGAFLVSTEVARGMRDSRTGGSIINIGSVLGTRQAKNIASYGVSKAGLIQLTKMMALELARDNIRVNALSPGYFDTDINHAMWDTPGGAALVRRIPQRRLGVMEDLDGAILLLASESSRFMTGSVIVVDGGHLVNTL